MKILFFILMSVVGFVIGFLNIAIAKYIVREDIGIDTKEFKLSILMIITSWVIITASCIPSIAVVDSLSNHINELERRINTIEENTQHNSVDTLVISDIKIPN